MLKRTLFIENPCHVSSKLNQLVLRNKKTDEEKTVPIEDIGFVVFENGECTFSLQALSKLNENNVAAIFCNDKHLPASMLLTLDANDVQSQMFAHQLNASEPLKKQLWQQTIKAKITNQALLLKSFGTPNEMLKRCAANVKSGDSTNEEAKASRYYWSNFFTDASTRPKKQDLLSMTIPVTLSERSESKSDDASTRPKKQDLLSMTNPDTLSERSESKSDDASTRPKKQDLLSMTIPVTLSERSESKSDHTSTRPDKEHRDSLSMTKKFVRDRFGDPPNNLFNYGYAILRAAVARALAGSGLLPTLGIHHHNKYNSFCLADDIMEPYRPFVDRIVHSIVQEGKDFSVLTTELKARLLTVLTEDIEINGTTSPLMVGLSRTTASLAECFAGERKTMKYPEMIAEKSS